MAFAVLPARVTVNTPGSALASAALESVAAIVTVLVGGTMSVRQALAPAGAGAGDWAGLDPRLMSAKSVLPASSVTVRRTVVVPLVGAGTGALGPLAITVPPTDHEYVETVRLHAARLPEPSSVTDVPAA